MKRTTFWLAFLSAVRGGRERVAAEINGLGIGAGINYRLGDGGSPGDGASEANTLFWIDSFGQNNVTAWMYSHPNNSAREIALWRRAYDWGVRRFVVNAEVEWKISGANDIARRYSQEMRAAFSDCFIAHAPFAFRGIHGYNYSNSYAFPYVGFGDLDQSFDQLYVEEFNMSAVGAHARYDTENSAYFKKYPTLFQQNTTTVGDIYGSDLNRVWGANVPGIWTQNSFNRHVENSRRRGESDFDFYSIDASLAETDATQSKPWHAVKAWAARVATQSDATLALRAEELLDDEALVCLEPALAAVCWGRFGHHTQEAK